MNEWMNLWIILTVLTEFLLFSPLLYCLVFYSSNTSVHTSRPFIFTVFPHSPFSDLSSSPSLSLTLLSFYCFFLSAFPLFCFLLSSTTLFAEAKVSVTECSMEVQMCKFADAASFIVIVLHFLMSQLPPLCHTKAWLNVASHYHVKEPGFIFELLTDSWYHLSNCTGDTLTHSLEELTERAADERFGIFWSWWEWV